MKNFVVKLKGISEAIKAKKFKKNKEQILAYKLVFRVNSRLYIIFSVRKRNG